MLKLILCLTSIVIVILPKSCESAVAIYPKQDKPPEFQCQRGCFLKHLYRVILYNETFYNVGKECASYTCHTNDETTQFTCGAIAAGPNCTLVEGDLNLKYPDCCKKVICPRKIQEPIYTLPTEKPAIM